MLFSVKGIDWFPSFLGEITRDGQYARKPKGRRKYFPYCKFDTTRPVAWLGGDCPLPKGVMYKVQLRGDWEEHWRADHNCVWRWRSHKNHAIDVIAFQVTGLAPGYKYPWE